MAEKKYLRVWSRILLTFLGLLAVFIVIIGGFVLWAETPAKPLPEALAVLEMWRDLANGWYLHQLPISRQLLA
jgi:hypothetical protein